jgi:hypothetical protein
MKTIRINEQSLENALKEQVKDAFNKTRLSGHYLPVHIWEDGEVDTGNWLSNNSWVEGAAFTYKVSPWESELEEYDTEVEICEKFEAELEALKVALDESTDFEFILCETKWIELENVCGKSDATETTVRLYNSARAVEQDEKGKFQWTACAPSGNGVMAYKERLK